MAEFLAPEPGSHARHQGAAQPLTAMRRRNANIRQEAAALGLEHLCRHFRQQTERISDDQAVGCGNQDMRPGVAQPLPDSPRINDVAVLRGLKSLRIQGLVEMRHFQPQLANAVGVGFCGFAYQGRAAAMR